MSRYPRRELIAVRVPDRNFLGFQNRTGLVDTVDHDIGILQGMDDASSQIVASTVSAAFQLKQ